MSEWPEHRARCGGAGAGGLLGAKAPADVFLTLSSLEARPISCVRLPDLWANDVHYGRSAVPSPLSLLGAV